MYLRIMCNKLQPLYKNNGNKRLFNRTYYWPNVSKSCKISKVVQGLQKNHRYNEIPLTGSMTVFRSKQNFHTTNPTRALPPILWVVLRPILKFAAVIAGRGLRKWWANLPKNKRKFIIDEISKNRQKIFAGSVLCTGLVCVYYVIHLVQDPITKRRKFLIFSEAQINQMSMIQCETIMENYKSKIVTSGYQYQYVLKTAQRILQANNDLPGTARTWQVFIVDEVETLNAFVLPSGQIFIFTGMLAAVSNEDQLAVILAHEMAHALLSHSAEAESTTHLFEMLMLLPLVALWTLLPGAVALTSHYLTEYMSSVLFELPFSRRLEAEADHIGLEMVARACYDPRQASVFWRKMEKLSEDEDIEWLSTHPSHRTRYQSLDVLMPKAFKILRNYCSKSSMDPRSMR